MANEITLTLNGATTTIFSEDIVPVIVAGQLELAFVKCDACSPEIEARYSRQINVALDLLAWIRQSSSSDENDKG